MKNYLPSINAFFHARSHTVRFPKKDLQIFLKTLPDVAENAEEVSLNGNEK